MSKAHKEARLIGLILYWRLGSDFGWGQIEPHRQRFMVQDYLKCHIFESVHDKEIRCSSVLELRRELYEAVEYFPSDKTLLIIPYVGRLITSSEFLQTLSTLELEFVALDFPELDRRSLPALIAVARRLREWRSEQIRLGQAKARKRGTAIGSPANLSNASADRGRRIGRQVSRRKARIFAQTLSSTIGELQRSGITSANGIAKALNARNIPARLGGRWSAKQAQRLLSRLSYS